jgi:hypothetical protein
LPGKITIDPINGNDIINSPYAAAHLQYSGTEQKLDGATLTFIYQINHGSNRIPWPGATPTTAADGKWLTPVTGEGYTGSSPDGVYTFTASCGSVSASRTLIQADHIGQLGFLQSPFEAVGLAFDGETQQLASTPTFIQVDQFITAEQAGIAILQRDGIITNNQATTLQDFFTSELQVLGGKALSSNLLPAAKIAQLTTLQADTATYVKSAPALVALQPNDAGWTMPLS